MSSEIKHRRGTEVEHATFTGANGEITVNTSTGGLRVHDGLTVGGKSVGDSAQTVTATGTTTPRSLADRFGDRYADVRDFGAVLDGVTDDKDAFDAAAGAIGYESVYVPGGRCYLSGNIAYEKKLILGGEVEFTGVVPQGFGITDGSILKNTTAVESLKSTKDAQFVRFISMRKDESPTKNSESDALICIATTDVDSSTYKADAVGIGARGYISSINPNGRAWGLNAYARVAQGGDGLLHAIEANIENKGSDVSEPDSPKAKYGINITTKPGSNPATAAIKIGTGSDFHYGYWAAPASFVDNNSKFIELQGKMSVDAFGRTAVGSSDIEGMLKVYRADDKTQVLVETSGTQEASTKYRKTGVRNWVSGLDAADNHYKITVGESLATAPSRIFTLTSDYNMVLNDSSSGGGSGVICIKNASAIPSTQGSDGGIMYVENGSLKYRGSGGTVTTIAGA